MPRETIHDGLQGSGAKRGEGGGRDGVRWVYCEVISHRALGGSQLVPSILIATGAASKDVDCVKSYPRPQ